MFVPKYAYQVFGDGENRWKQINFKLINARKLTRYSRRYSLFLKKSKTSKPLVPWTQIEIDISQVLIWLFQPQASFYVRQKIHSSYVKLLDTKVLMNCDWFRHQSTRRTIHIMKSIFLPVAVSNGARRILWLAITGAMMFLHQNAKATGPTIDLGTASSFAILGGSDVANAGTTTIIGDVGSFPTATIAGFGTVNLNGTNYGGDAIAQNAQNDLANAYGDAVGLTPATVYAAIFDLGGQTLAPGVYNDPSSFGITGNLILDAQGDTNAVWVFQAGSTLVTAADSTITLANGAQASDVFWLVGTSATIGANTDFEGNILAFNSITLANGVVDDGRLLAENGAVSLTSDTITVPAPEPGIMTLLGCVMNGTFQLTVSMVPPYYPVIIQASTNLVNWSDIYTNTPPFNFTDQMATTFPSRFYRAALFP